MQKTLSPDQQQLVTENMKFAQQLAWHYGHCGVELEDLQQESCYGLCMAALHFDSQYNVKFTTYATFWCKKYILQAIEDYGMPMRMTQKDREEAKILCLDESFGNGDTDDTFADQVLYRIYLQQEAEETCQEVSTKHFEAALAALTTQERRAIKYLYGIDNGIERSSKEVARLLKINKSRVTQLRETAMRKLERRLAA